MIVYGFNLQLPRTPMEFNLDTNEAWYVHKDMRRRSKSTLSVTYWKGRYREEGLVFPSDPDLDMDEGL